MSVTIDSFIINNDVFWIDEFETSYITANAARTIGGKLVMVHSTAETKTMTLKIDWADNTVITGLQSSVAAKYNSTVDVVYNNITYRCVYRTDIAPGAMEITPILDRPFSGYTAQDRFDIVLYLEIVGVDGVILV